MFVTHELSILDRIKYIFPQLGVSENNQKRKIESYAFFVYSIRTLLSLVASFEETNPVSIIIITVGNFECLL